MFIVSNVFCLGDTHKCNERIIKHFITFFSKTHINNGCLKTHKPQIYVMKNRRTDRVAHYSIQTIALEERRDQNTFKKNLERNGTYLKNTTKQLSRRRSKHFLFVFNECGVCLVCVCVCVYFISTLLFSTLLYTNTYIFFIFKSAKNSISYACFKI